MGLTLFIVLAVVSIISALAVVFNKNVVHSALALLVNFGVLAIFYFMLNAQFLAVAQILVYAGAIVVLFLFVVMLLGAELGEDVPTWFTARNVIMMGLGLLLLTIIGTTVSENQFVFQREGKTGDLTPELVAEFGQVEVIGSYLFTDYVLSFHLVAVLLSVGVIGVLWLAQQYKKQMFSKEMQGESE